MGQHALLSDTTNIGKDVVRLVESRQQYHRTIATSPNAGPELRLDAAERAESMGALNTEVLRQLYAGVTISDSALDNPVTTGDSKRSPLSRARQYRKA